MARADREEWDTRICMSGARCSIRWGITRLVGFTLARYYQGQASSGRNQPEPWHPAASMVVAQASRSLRTTTGLPSTYYCSDA